MRSPTSTTGGVTHLSIIGILFVPTSDFDFDFCLSSGLFFGVVISSNAMPRHARATPCSGHAVHARYLSTEPVKLSKCHLIQTLTSPLVRVVNLE